MGFQSSATPLWRHTAARVYLHAAELTLQHPASGKELTFERRRGRPGRTSPCLRQQRHERAVHARQSLPCLDCEALISPEDTDAYRVIHGASDGCRLVRGAPGTFPPSQAGAAHCAQPSNLSHLTAQFSARGAYHKTWPVKSNASAVPKPHHNSCSARRPRAITVQENGVQFVRVQEGIQ